MDTRITAARVALTLSPGDAREAKRARRDLYLAKIWKF